MKEKSLCLEECKELVRLRSLWLFWGWLDVRQRYRRSVLGPIWATVTMAVSIITTSIVYSSLFKQDTVVFLPYVATGFVLWSLISGCICEACTVFIHNEKYITQLKLPLLIYPVRLIWRYTIIFLHHLIPLLVILLIFRSESIASVSAALLGLFLICLNLLWIGLSLGLFSTRLRDIPVLVATIFQVLFLITPIMWPISALGQKFYIASWNPFYHLVEVVRAPLTAGVNSQWQLHLTVVTAMAVLGLCFSSLLLNTWKKDLVNWL